MDPLTLALLIGSGVNLISSFATNRQNELNQKNQYQQNVRDWWAENEYNSPENQAERLRKAGFNPASYLSNYSAGSISPVSPISLDAPQIDLSTLMQISQVEKQNEFLDLKTQYLESEELRKNLEFLQDTQFREELLKDAQMKNKLTEHDLEIYLKDRFTASKDKSPAIDMAKYIWRLLTFVQNNEKSSDLNSFNSYYGRNSSW